MTYIEERRINFEVLGDDVEAEEVSVDALATHSILVPHLVLGASLSQKNDAVRVLQIESSINSIS